MAALKVIDWTAGVTYLQRSSEQGECASSKKRGSSVGHQAAILFLKFDESSSQLGACATWRGMGQVALVRLSQFSPRSVLPFARPQNPMRC